MKNDEEYRRRRQRLLRQQRIDNDDDVDRSFGLNGVKCCCVLFFLFSVLVVVVNISFFLVVVIPFQVHNTNNNNKNLFNLKQEKGGVLGCFCFGIKTIWSFFWVCFLLKTKAPFFVFVAFFQKNCSYVENFKFTAFLLLFLVVKMEVMWLLLLWQKT